MSEPLRLLPATAALAERNWLTGAPDDRLADAQRLLSEFDGEGLGWARGELALWLTELGLPVPTDLAMAEPYVLQLQGRPSGAASSGGRWGAPTSRRSPWSRAVTLTN